MEGFEARRAFGVTRLQDETSPWCTSDFSKWSNVNIVKTKLDWIFCNTLRRLKINIAPISAHIHLLFTHKIFHEFEKLFGFFGEGKGIFLSWSIFYSRFFWGLHVYFVMKQGEFRSILFFNPLFRSQLFLDLSMCQQIYMNPQLKQKTYDEDTEFVQYVGRQNYPLCRLRAKVKPRKVFTKLY